MKNFGKTKRRTLALALSVAMALSGAIPVSAAQDPEPSIGTTAVSDTMDGVKSAIEVKTPGANDTKLDVTIPDTERFKAVYNGTDYEQVIGDDLTIYKPIVDTTVKVSFKVTDSTNANTFSFKEVEVKVPGQYQQAAGDNPAPAILPELREWKGRTGNFTPGDGSRIVIASEDLKAVAEAFAADYQVMTGKEIEIVVGNTANAGDFYFSLTTDTSKGLQKEGYLMDISDKVTVEAETTTGAYWSTRTILQSLKLTGNIPQGITRDYPLYSVRGFIFDVGRNAYTLDFLKQVVQEMAWYKMNDLQVHLMDNLISLEHYSDDEVMNAYSGFRLESDVKKGGNGGKNMADLTSTDVFYTKDEFRSFIKDSRVCGVNIVPEIDVPAHSLGLTKVRPDLRFGTSGRNTDHLDLVRQYDECVTFVKSVFDEYMGKSLADPVFDEDTIVHIGGDEYTAGPDAYRKFVDEMLGYVQDTGRDVRVWGSLTSLKGTQNIQVRSKGVQMNLWNDGWANMNEMYKLGFDMINCNDGLYYIVPNAGYYYDYLNDNTVYNTAINTIGSTTIPAGDKQMIGGAFAVWNDMTDYLDNGVSEYDTYDRIENVIPLFGAKLWGKGAMSLEQANAANDKIGHAPQTNFGYEVASKDPEGAILNLPMDTMEDASANGYDITKGKNASIEDVDGKKALRLTGGESYVSSPVATAGLLNDLRVKVKRLSSKNDEQILFESAYGCIKAVQTGTGCVGFTREGMDYSFNYELPVNEWVELEFKNQQNVISLYVNGSLVDTLGDGERVEARPLLATMMFPVEKIGSETKAFVGYVDDVRLGSDGTFNSTMALDYVVQMAEALGTSGNAQLETLVKQAKELFAKYAPDASAVSSLAAQIQAEIDKLEYNKADYSRVEAYKALVPSDLSLFTDKSVEALQRAVNSVRENLPAEMQRTVNGYEKNIENALNALELKSVADANYVDNAKLTATASSYQDAGSSPAMALDGDLGTIWHSKWSEQTMPHWIDLEINTPMAVNGLTYITRQSGPNGNATKYRIETSDDGKTYKTIKEGTLSSDNGEKVIEFDTVTTKHVRLVYVEAPNNNGSAAELKLHAANVKADVEGLNSWITQASAIKNASYTAASWDALQAKISEADTLAKSANPDINAVENMKRQILAAMVALRMEAVSADKTALQQAVAAAKELKEADYTAETWSDFAKALSGAEAVLAKEDAGQEDIDIAQIELQAKQTALEKASLTPKPPQKDMDYKDVNKGDWYYNYVEDVYNKKLMTGLKDDVFGPSDILVRAQFATILYRMEGQPKVTYSNKFGDVPAAQFFTNPVMWAAADDVRVVTGYSDGNFGPNDKITREQMALMMYRYAKYKGYDMSARADLSAFPDQDQVSDYAKTAIQWCVAKKLISGQGEGVKKLNPQGDTSRAECATIISRYSKLYE